jgi:hypothetical protein
MLELPRAARVSSIVSCDMPRIRKYAVPVPIGVVALFAAYILGGYIGGSVLPESFGINKMETVATKVGSSVAITIVSFALARFVFRSLDVALVCFAVTEAVVLLIIVQITGLSLSNASDFAFNLGWLYSITWNVFIAFVIGTALGHLWYHSVANKPLHSPPQ